MSQKDLAKQMGVSPVYVGKLLKGGENLTIETICKLQRVIGEQLINVIKPYNMVNYIRLAAPYVASDRSEDSAVYKKKLSPSYDYSRPQVLHIA